MHFNGQKPARLEQPIGFFNGSKWISEVIKYILESNHVIAYTGLLHIFKIPFIDFKASLLGVSRIMRVDFRSIAFPVR